MKIVTEIIFTDMLVEMKDCSKSKVDLMVTPRTIKNNGYFYKPQIISEKSRLLAALANKLIKCTSP